MLYYWLLFFFVVFGAKLILAMVMIYFLLPSYRSCSRCDDDTLLVRTHPLGRWLFRLFLGRVEWRWCPRCGWEGLARTGRKPFLHPDVTAGRTAPSRK